MVSPTSQPNETDRDALVVAVTRVDRDELLAPVVERFGIEPGVFDDYLFIRPNKRTVHVVARDHTGVARPKADSIGLPFMRMTLRYPKLTTAAAMLFGPHARRHVIGLDREQADRFLSRQPVEVRPEQALRCDSRGYVLVRVEEVFLGVAFYAAEERRVQSLLPKAWSLADDVSAFDSEVGRE